ncbi:pimeloyl-ACP methyl ester carboxylesterase [Tumebacillus sp. BK434]|uniref:alpha/beta fold hydrolase n=1 Tax=Tumebacillus sp. BK434 TaxID=2512169 RepID=UPI0010DB2B00|nr:alpha/beta fold hydrolase [Tumebacillus sp. BK434]TCP52883.1 pimeloyl-ACP methyl ester carboxylesterase [Tumebacillus sp. BK434]
MKRYGVRVDGREVRIYEQPGAAGLTMVFLHGVGSTGKAWAYQMRGLKASGRMIAVEVPGFSGVGELPETVGELSDLAPFVLRVLDVLGVADAIWVGNSLGGRIALEAALGAPQRVRGLVLAGSAGIRLPGVEMPQLHALRPEELERRLFWQPELFHALQTEQSRAAAQAARRLYDRLAAATAVMDLRTRLGEVQVPALVIWGRHDGVIPLPIGEALAAGLTAAELLVLDHAAHVPQIEQPERVLAAILRFLGKFGVAAE